MEYARYIDERSVGFSPRVIFENDKYIANPTKEMLLERGYKPVVTDEEPEIEVNQYLEPSYSDDGDYISRHWIVKEFEPIEEE